MKLLQLSLGSGHGVAGGDPKVFCSAGCPNGRLWSLELSILFLVKPWDPLFLENEDVVERL